MACIQYIDKKFSTKSLQIIRTANQICQQYQAQGYDLTLRQLYYQFVARGLIANKQTEYKRLGSIINDARLAGELDWDFIVDRTRHIRSVSHWSSPKSILKTCADQFAIDRWSNQDVRIEVWIEKDALVGVIEQVCEENDVSYFACRGYVSQSEVWGAAQRLRQYIEAGQRVVVLHLGDHDPSGIDMSRDIEDRLEMFIKKDVSRVTAIDVIEKIVAEFFSDEAPTEELWCVALQMFMDEEGEDPDRNNFLRWPEEAKDEVEARFQAQLPTVDLEIRRIALTWAQVQQYNPPPNPAKFTDSRAQGYVDVYGTSSWELDALDPATINALIETEIERERDDARWVEATDEQDEHRRLIGVVARTWDTMTVGL